MNFPEFCPLFGLHPNSTVNYCIEDRCAWYFQSPRNNNDCAIVCIARALERLADTDHDED